MPRSGHFPKILRRSYREDKEDLLNRLRDSLSRGSDPWRRTNTYRWKRQNTKAKIPHTTTLEDESERIDETSREHEKLAVYHGSSKNTKPSFIYYPWRRNLDIVILIFLNLLASQLNITFGVYHARCFWRGGLSLERIVIQPLTLYVPATTTYHMINKIYSSPYTHKDGFAFLSAVFGLLTILSMIPYAVNVICICFRVVLMILVGVVRILID